MTLCDGNHVDMAFWFPWITILTKRVITVRRRTQGEQRVVVQQTSYKRPLMLYSDISITWCDSCLYSRVTVESARSLLMSWCLFASRTSPSIMLVNCSSRCIPVLPKWNTTMSLKSYCSENQPQFIPAGHIQQTTLSQIWALFCVIS